MKISCVKLSRRGALDCMFRHVEGRAARGWRDYSRLVFLGAWLRAYEDTLRSLELPGGGSIFKMRFSAPGKVHSCGELRVFGKLLTKDLSERNRFALRALPVVEDVSGEVRPPPSTGGNSRGFHGVPALGE